MRFDEPTLLMFPRPLTHRFHNPPADGPDFTCARLDFEGGSHNPLARALPPLVALPLSRVPGLHAALELLFAEADRVRRSEEHTSELQSLMRISYAVFCLKKKKQNTYTTYKTTIQQHT